MKENWLALFLCINIEISPDKALIKMGLCKNSTQRSKNIKHSDSEKEYIANLKEQGKTYTELSEMFSMTRGQIASIVRHHRIKKAARTPAKVVQATI